MLNRCSIERAPLRTCSTSMTPPCARARHRCRCGSTWPDSPSSSAAGKSSGRRGGVFVGGLVRGVMWAQVMSDRGLWLGVITCELERDGAAVMTTAALVPEWAVQRRRPGSERRAYGKSSSRPTATQRANPPAG